jgi:flagellar hook-associated protein 1 FlgK
VSTFSGLNTATTALWAQQRGLDVTGQNIANVNTAGYSRQRAELQSVGGNVVPATYAVSNQVGQGVNADTVIRIRDAFLETRALTERANSAQRAAESEGLTQIESAFREPGDNGVQSMLADMWDGWSDVVNHPEDLAARSQLLQRADTLAAGLRTTSSSLEKQWTQTRGDLAVMVTDVNAAAGSVADMNVAIRKATLAGLPVNELADKRDALVSTLAEKVGATSVPAADGMVDVVIGGTSLVSGGSALGLQLTGTLDSRTAALGNPQIVTKPGGSQVGVGGNAAGQLSMLTRVLPDYRTQLDGVAAQLAATVNGAQAGYDAAHTGYDLDGNVGGPVFGTDPAGAVITADTIAVVMTRPEEIAAAGLAPDASGPSLDNGNADGIYQLRLQTSGVDATYRTLITDLGVESAVAKRNLDIQGVISTQVDAAKDSVSGVNLDEEMTNMLQFQHAYSAAARMITAIDETLDVLINRTGRVGL